MLKEFTPGAAVEELHHRRKDVNLLQRVEQFIGEMPTALPKEPFAAICRQVATARREDIAFMELSKQMALSPFWPTFEGDNFTTKNPDKVKLCKLPLDDSSLHVRNRKVVRKMDKYDGTHKLNEVWTDCYVGGKPLGLPDLHHLVRKHVLNGIAGNTADFTDWLYTIATREGAEPGSNLAKWYYPYYLALFVVHGVLVEDFCGGPNGSSGLGRFVAEVVNPAAMRVKAELGLDPIYVRLPWQEGYELYPASILSVIDPLMF